MKVSHSNNTLKVKRARCRSVRTKLVYLSVSLVLGMCFSPSFAAFELKKYSINSGGGLISGGAYTLQGSISQSVASESVNAGSYSMNGGFRHRNAGNSDVIFRNGFE